MEAEIMLEEILQHIDRASLLGGSAASLLILGVNLTLTLVHSLQELRGRLWRYFGAIAGVWIPDFLGVLLFFVVLTVSLWAIGWIGITGYLPFIGQSERRAAWAVGTLIGARLSDGRYSHVLLDRRGYRPNPGLQSTPYYFAEAILLAVVFSPLLTEHYIVGALGFLGGWIVFLFVLPFIRACRVVPWLRREQWKAGEPSPTWARLRSEVPESRLDAGAR
jgi:hypothetical protein